MICENRSFSALDPTSNNNIPSIYLFPEVNTDDLIWFEHRKIKKDLPLTKLIEKNKMDMEFN